MKKYLPQLYKWHNRLGIIAVIPTVLWCLSGVMHPFIAHWFRPEIPKTFKIPTPIDTSLMTLDISEVAKKNELGYFKTIRLASQDDQVFYQFKLPNDELRYYNASTGKEWVNADEEYAIGLARYYLEDYESDVKNISIQTDFDGQYKFINRLLPVYKIDFDRKDNMTIYVETSSGRLATHQNTFNKAFVWIFDNFHNFSFLNSISNNTLRIVIMVVFLVIISLSALLGILIYGFLWKALKKQSKTQKRSLRGYHRRVGIAVAFVTFTFAFSGGYHALRKLTPNYLPVMVIEPIKKVDNLKVALNALPFNGPLLNINIVDLNHDTYYQLESLNEERQKVYHYYNTKTGQLLENGNQKYALYLANLFGEQLKNDYSIERDWSTIDSITTVNAFQVREYGFIFKRLPVERIEYNNEQNSVLFIETASSRLAAKIEKADKREGFSFAVLHKFFLIDWAGKNVRDLVMLFSALGVLAVSLLGLFMYIKKLKK